MKVLVTGGSGFIGSHLIVQLLKKGIEIKVYDNLTSGSLENISDCISDIQLIKADIRDFETLISSMQGVDWVFHLAALTSVSQSVTYPILTHEINITGTLNVLLAALKVGVSRIVIASSCAVYGDTQKLPLKETDLPAPRSPYAASKLMAEILAESFYYSYGLETVCLRYFNVYGYRQRADSSYAAAIPRFIQCYKQKKPPQVYGNGMQTRDFIHVTDVASANILAASLPSNILMKNRTFNIGTGITTSISKLLKIISSEAGYYIEPEFQETRVGDVLASYADNTLAREYLKFNPVVDLETGIKDIYLK